MYEPNPRKRLLSLIRKSNSANFKTRLLFLLYECRYIYSVEYGRVVDTKSGHDDASKY